VGNDWQIVITDSREEVMPKLLEKTGFMEVEEVEKFMRIGDDYHAEIEEITEAIAELEEQLEEVQAQGEPEEIGEIEAELAETREELEEVLSENQFELDFIKFFADRLDNAKTYNLNFILGGEWCTVHYALGETPAADRVGVVTISFTV
jgi:CRISPR/Cas system CSM-associated protein Csm4 (group 5 of RAMP superfamily)